MFQPPGGGGGTRGTEDERTDVSGPGQPIATLAVVGGLSLVATTVVAAGAVLATQNQTSQGYSTSQTAAASNAPVGTGTSWFMRHADALGMGVASKLEAVVTDLCETAQGVVRSACGCAFL